MVFFTPREMMKIGIQSSLLMIEAQRLLALRMISFWRMTPQRTAPHVDQARPAIALAPMPAILENRPKIEKTPAKLRTVRQAANSNVTRLARRAPGKPA